MSGRGGERRGRHPSSCMTAIRWHIKPVHRCTSRDDSYSVEELPGGSSGEWYDGRWRAKRTDIVLVSKAPVLRACHVKAAL
jgi:hypothetical protein